MPLYFKRIKHLNIFLKQTTISRNRQVLNVSKPLISLFKRLIPVSSTDCSHTLKQSLVFWLPQYPLSHCLQKRLYIVLFLLCLSRHLPYCLLRHRRDYELPWGATGRSKQPFLCYEMRCEHYVHSRNTGITLNPHTPQTHAKRTPVRIVSGSQAAQLYCSCMYSTYGNKT